MPITQIRHDNRDMWEGLDRLTALANQVSQVREIRRQRQIDETATAMLMQDPSEAGAARAEQYLVSQMAPKQHSGIMGFADRLLGGLGAPRGLSPLQQQVLGARGQAAFPTLEDKYTKERTGAIGKGLELQKQALDQQAERDRQRAEQQGEQNRQQGERDRQRAEQYEAAAEQQALENQMAAQQQERQAQMDKQRYAMNRADLIMKLMQEKDYIVDAEGNAVGVKDKYTLEQAEAMADAALGNTRLEQSNMDTGERMLQGQGLGSIRPGFQPRTEMGNESEQQLRSLGNVLPNDIKHMVEKAIQRGYSPEQILQSKELQPYLEKAK